MTQSVELLYNRIKFFWQNLQHLHGCWTEVNQNDAWVVHMRECLRDHHEARESYDYCMNALDNIIL